MNKKSFNCSQVNDHQYGQGLIKTASLSSNRWQFVTAAIQRQHTNSVKEMHRPRLMMKTFIKNFSVSLDTTHDTKGQVYNFTCLTSSVRSWSPSWGVTAIMDDWTRDCRGGGNCGGVSVIHMKILNISLWAVHQIYSFFWQTKWQQIQYK